MIGRGRTACLAVAVLLGLAPAGCTTGKRVAETGTPPAVAVYGELRDVVHGGDLSARISLDSLGHEPARIGLGALSELRGEVTVLDGYAWLAYPDGEDQARVEVAPAGTEGATLFVTAVVPVWEIFEIERDVRWEELDAVVESLATAAGLPAGGPFPFVIDGTMKHLAWHVIDGSRIDPLADAGGGHQAHAQASVRSELDDGDASLVGFFSRHHEGVFTHMGSALHVHACMTEPRASGHVDRVDVAAGAALRLPAPSY